jgi:hypothetical protein
MKSFLKQLDNVSLTREMPEQISFLTLKTDQRKKEAETTIGKPSKKIYI